MGRLGDIEVRRSVRIEFVVGLLVDWKALKLCVFRRCWVVFFMVVIFKLLRGVR